MYQKAHFYAITYSNPLIFDNSLLNDPALEFLMSLQIWPEPIPLLLDFPHSDMFQSTKLEILYYKRQAVLEDVLIV